MATLTRGRRCLVPAQDLRLLGGIGAGHYRQVLAGLQHQIQLLHGEHVERTDQRRELVGVHIETQLLTGALLLPGLTGESIGCVKSYQPGAVQVGVERHPISIFRRLSACGSAD